MKRQTPTLGGYKGQVVLNLPAVELNEDRMCFGASAMTKIRCFFRQLVSKTEVALEGGTFAISADVSYLEHQGSRRVVLSRWKAGESMSQALDAADIALKDLRRVIKENQPKASREVT